MPTLTIEGRDVDIDDAFLKLSPEDQNKQVEEIAAQLRISSGSGSKGSSEAPNTNLFAAAVDSGARFASGALRGADRLAKAVPGLGSLAPDDANNPALMAAGAADSVREWANYERPEGLDAATLKKQWAESDWTGLADTILRGGAHSAVEGLADVAAATRTPGLALLSNTEQNLEQRQANNNGRDLSVGDVAASVAGGAGEMVLDRFAGRAFKGGPVKAAVGGVASDAGSGVVQEAATKAGTDRGFSVDEAADSALESAVFGAAGGVQRKAVSAAARVAANKVSGRSSDARVAKELETNKAQVLSDERVRQRVALEMEDAANDGDISGPDAESRALKNLTSKLYSEFATTVEHVAALGGFGEASRDVAHSLLDKEAGEASLAKRHNRFITEGGIAQVRERIGDPALADAFEAQLRDLNTASKSALYKGRKGPGARVGAVIGAAIGGIKGVPGGAAGIGAGAVLGSRAGEWVGSKADRFMGVGKPDAIRRAEARSGALKRMGVDPGAAGAALNTIREMAAKTFGQIYGVDINDRSLARLTVAQKLKQEREVQAAEAKRLRQAQQAADAQARKLAQEAAQLLKRSKKETAAWEAAQNSPIRLLRQSQLQGARKGVDRLFGDKPEPPAPAPKEDPPLRHLPMGQVQAAQRGVDRLFNQPEPAEPQPTDSDGMPRTQQSPFPVLDPSITAGQLRSANSGVMRLPRVLQQLQEAAARQQKAAETEAKRVEALAKAAAEVEAKVAANDQRRQQLGGSLDELAPRTDGWYVEAAAKHHERYPRIKLEYADFEAGLAQAVKLGHISEAGAQIALKVPGAWLGQKIKDPVTGKYKPDGLMLSVINSAQANAFRRAGIEPTADAFLREMQMGAEERARQTGRNAAARKQGFKDKEEELKAAKQATRAAKKPQEPRVKVKAPKGASNASAAPAPAPAATAPASTVDVDGEMAVTARSAALLSEIKANDAKTARAIKKAPTAALAEAAKELRESNDPGAKRAIYDRVKAQAETPAQLDWVGRYLHPLTFFGSGMGKVRSEFEKKNGSLSDPALVKPKGAARQVSQPARGAPPKVGGDKISARDAVLGSIEGAYESSLVVDEAGVIWRLPQGKGHEVLKQLDPGHSYVELHMAGTDGAGAGRPDGKQMTEPQMRRLRELEAEFKKANGGVPLNGGYIVLSQ